MPCAHNLPTPSKPAPPAGQRQHGDACMPLPRACLPADPPAAGGRQPAAPGRQQRRAAAAALQLLPCLPPGGGMEPRGPRRRPARHPRRRRQRQGARRHAGQGGAGSRAARLQGLGLGHVQVRCCTARRGLKKRASVHLLAAPHPLPAACVRLQAWRRWPRAPTSLATSRPAGRTGGQQARRGAGAAVPGGHQQRLDHAPAQLAPPTQGSCCMRLAGA